MTQDTANAGQYRDVGAALRQAREDKGISIASAAMQTNLRADIIEKLEANAFADIGAPVFARGYLNIYARFLGLSEEAAAVVFPSGEATRQNETLRLNAANVASQNKPYRRSMARGWISLFIVLVLGGLLISQLLNDQSWLMQQIRGTFGQQPPPVVQEPADDADATNTDPQTMDFTVEVAGNDVRDGLPELTSISDDGADVALSLTSVDSDAEAAEGQGDAEVAVEETTPATLGIVLQTSQENWIKITSADGKETAKIYKPGAEITLDAAGSPYRFNIGRPNAVTLTVNGMQKPLQDYRLRGRHFEVSVPNE